MKETREQGRALVVVAIVATAGLAAAAAWYFAGGSKRISSAGPVRTLIPSSAAVYVELRDAGTLWDGVSASAAAADFAKSRARHDLFAMQSVKEAQALVEDLSKRTKFELTAANAKKLFGREIAVGFVPATDASPPKWVLASKIDRAGLAKDLIAGDADFSKLHDAIDARAGMGEFKVTRAEHRGIAMSQAAKGTTTFSFALLGDALVVAPDSGLVSQSIDAFLDDGKGSISTVAAFTKDVASVPATAAVLEWYDLERMRASRASVSAGIDALTGVTKSAAAVDHVLDSSRDIRSIARATEIPGGDPYEMKWTWSGGDAPAAKAPLSAVLLPGAPVYLELRGASQLFAAWDRSPLLAKLRTGPLGKKFDEWLDAPESLTRRLGNSALGMSAGELDEDEDEDEGDDEAGAAAETEHAGKPAIGAFEMKTMMRVVRRMTEELAGSSVGLAVATKPDASSAEIAFATRVNDGTRLILLAAQGAGIANGEFTVETHGEHRIAVASHERADGSRTCVAHAAGYVILGTSADVVRRAIDGLETKDAPASASPRTAALAAVGSDAQFALHVELGDLLDSVGPNPMTASIREAMPAMPRSITMSAQLDGNFEAARIRYRAAHREGHINVMAPGRPVPSVRATLPADPFAHAVQAIDLPAVWRHLEHVLPGEHDGLAAAAGAFREASGVDLVTGLLPALGPEIAVSFHRSEAKPTATPGARPEPAIPGMLFALEMQQPEIVRKAVDGLLATAQRAIDEAADARGTTKKQIFARTRLDSTDVISLDMPEAGMPVTPALAFHGSFLIIASDDSLIRATLAAGAPGGRPLGATPALERAVRGLPAGSYSAFLDWNGMLDQVGEYAPFIGPMVPEDADDADAPTPPEYPSNPRNRAAMDQWRKDTEAYQAEMSARGGARLRTYLDAARLIDVIGATGDTRDGADTAEVVIRFAK